MYFEPAAVPPSNVTFSVTVVPAHLCSVSLRVYSKNRYRTKVLNYRNNYV